jgi:hypothetical protein
MNNRSFEEDLERSNNPKLRKAWERIFRLKFGADAVINWKDEANTQLGFGTDLTITANNRRYSIETKTRNYTAFNNLFWIMEIIHHKYDKENSINRKHLSSKNGWIYTTTAEYIFHATTNKDGTEIIEAIFYDLRKFKSEAYKSEFQKFNNLWLSTNFSDGTFQLTLNKLIPLDIIRRDAGDFWHWKKTEW